MRQVERGRRVERPVAGEMRIEGEEIVTTIGPTRLRRFRVRFQHIAASMLALFDLDDTLHDDTAAYRSAAEEVAREIAAEHGIDALASRPRMSPRRKASGRASIAML